MASSDNPEFSIDHGPQFYDLNDLCEICQLTVDRISELVDYGVIDPVGSSSIDWRFPAQAILQVRRALRLQRDLELNLAGIALALELIDENERLRQELRALRSHLARFMA